MEKRKNNKIIIAVIALIAVAIAMFALYNTLKPETKAGSKEITVMVVHGDQSEKEFTYQTDEEYLAPVITSDGLAEGDEGEYGLFIQTVDGETADESKEQWWCITKGGEMVNVSASELVIEDGDQFELTLTEGY